MRFRTLTTILVLFVILAYLIVDTIEFEDVLDEHSRYCAYVGQGVWPDYRHIAEEECE